MVSIEQIKQLRQETNISVIECKNALEEANGDIEKAKEVLRKSGLKIAQKKAGRATQQGIIEAYIHPNKKIGVLVDVLCETDFVARSEDFKTLCHDIALHIAGANPDYVKPEDIPEKFLKGEKKIYEEQFSKTGKPSHIVEQMVEGKLKKCQEEISLLTQSFVKNPDKTIQEYIQEYIIKLGENIVVERFTRYEI